MVERRFLMAVAQGSSSRYSDDEEARMTALLCILKCIEISIKLYDRWNEHRHRSRTKRRRRKKKHT